MQTWAHRRRRSVRYFNSIALRILWVSTCCALAYGVDVVVAERSELGLSMFEQVCCVYFYYFRGFRCTRVGVHIESNIRYTINKIACPKHFDFIFDIGFENSKQMHYFRFGYFCMNYRIFITIVFVVGE